jgi:hypothetical protein
MFCALAFLKTAQKFDAYLASLGLSVAQTGSSMGMEMLIGLRALTGVAGGFRGMGNMFGGGSAAPGPGGAATGPTGATGSFMSGFTSMFKANSYVRDAVVDGGVRMGAAGSVGFVGRMFGGLAAGGGAELTGDSVSSVAARPASVSGSIAGEIADRSLKNYMPHMAGGAKTPGFSGGDAIPGAMLGAVQAGVKYSGTQITGGHIATTATTADGKTASVDLYGAAQYEKPDAPYSAVTASDGSSWYQIVSGDGMGAFCQTPEFSGDASESARVSAVFPGAPEGTILRTADDGVIEASIPAGGVGLWYSSAYYREPDAPHDNIQAADGLSWYAMQPHAEAPQFESGDAAAEYNGALFAQFMPGYEQQAVRIDGSRADDGIIEVRHGDGSGTAFYDKTMYQSPHGDYSVREDSRGNPWYAVPGTPSVERRPVYENGKPVRDGNELRTVNTESIKYKTTPTRFDAPKKRDAGDRKPPKPKKK